MFLLILASLPELSMKYCRLYDRQPLFRDIFTTLNSEGFNAMVRSISPRSPSNGSVLFADFIFAREA
jgi:hypothetical protein